MSRESAAPRSPFAPVDMVDEFSTVCVPLIKNTVRAILQEELAGVRGEVASLTGAIQTLTEAVSLQTRQFGKNPPEQDKQPGTGSCGPIDVPTAPAKVYFAPQDHTREGEGNLQVPSANPVRSASSASSNGMRVLKIVPMGQVIDPIASSASGKGFKRHSSVSELQQLRSNELLGRGKPKIQARPRDMELQGIVPASDAATPPRSDTTAKRSKSPVKKAETLRQLRETELVSSTNLDYPLWSAACLYFGACGILPWEHGSTSSSRHRARCTSVAAACYPWVVLIVMAGSTACCVLQLVPDVSLGCGLKSDLAIACGSVASLVAVGAINSSSELASCFKMLASRSWDSGRQDGWMHDSRQELLVGFCTWVCVVVSRGILTSVTSSPPGQMSETWLVFTILPFAVCSGVVLAAACCVMHICLGLGGLTDAYISSIDGTSLGESVQKWNELQALIRRAGASLQRCVAVLLCMVAVAMLLAAADFAFTFEARLQAVSLIPLMIIILGVLRAFFNAAEVTSKCSRVPQLINSLDFGTQIDNDRLYLVEYIVKSAAGFYVYEIRISSGMVLKYIYACCVMSITFANEMLKL